MTYEITFRRVESLLVHKPVFCLGHRIYDPTEYEHPLQAEIVRRYISYAWYLLKSEIGDECIIPALTSIEWDAVDVGTEGQALVYFIAAVHELELARRERRMNATLAS